MSWFAGLGIAIAVLVLMLFFHVLMVAISPKTDDERAWEDEKQMEAIREWERKKGIVQKHKQ